MKIACNTQLHSKQVEEQGERGSCQTLVATVIILIHKKNYNKKVESMDERLNKTINEIANASRNIAYQEFMKQANEATQRIVENIDSIFEGNEQLIKDMESIFEIDKNGLMPKIGSHISKLKIYAKEDNFKSSATFNKTVDGVADTIHDLKQITQMPEIISKLKNQKKSDEEYNEDLVKELENKLSEALEFLLKSTLLLSKDYRKNHIKNISNIIEQISSETHFQNCLSLIVTLYNKLNKKKNQIVYDRKRSKLDDLLDFFKSKTSKKFKNFEDDLKKVDLFGYKINIIIKKDYNSNVYQLLETYEKTKFVEMKKKAKKDYFEVAKSLISLPLSNNSSRYQNQIDNVSSGAIIGYASKTFSEYNWISARQAHGTAAEKVNTVLDKMQLKEASVEGDQNWELPVFQKNGPDRIVDGGKIQSKYYNNAAATVRNAFDDDTGLYKYAGQVLEVPKDQYDDAVKIMKQRILENKVPRVTDSEEAIKMVRAGVKYNTAVDIAKSGTVKGIVFDVQTGLVRAVSAAGISAMVAGAYTYWKTNDSDQALNAIVNVGKDAFVTSMSTHIICAQLARTALGQGTKAYLSQKMGEQLSVQLFGSGVGAIVSVGYKTIKDINKGLHPKAILKNVAKSSMTATGGLGGALLGAKLSKKGGRGRQIIGGLAGGIIGSMALSMVGESIFGYNEKDIMKKLEAINLLIIEVIENSELLPDEVKMLDFSIIIDLFQTEKGISFLMEDTEGTFAEILMFLATKIEEIKQRRAIFDFSQYENNYLESINNYKEDYNAHLKEEVVNFEDNTNRLIEKTKTKLEFV